MKNKILVLVLFWGISYISMAQSEISVDENKKQFENGTVLSSPIGTFLGRNFDICSIPYDPYLLGVYYNENLDQKPNPKAYKIPIKTSGITYVKYNTENGYIHKGDPVTSSSTPGVAMKATQSGIILGVALEDAQTNKNLIKIRVMVQYLKQ